MPITVRFADREVIEDTADSNVHVPDLAPGELVHLKRLSVQAPALKWTSLIGMAQRRSETVKSRRWTSGNMVSRDNAITVIFVILGTALWLVSREFVDSEFLQWVILIGVGVAIPSLLTRSE